MQRRIDKRSEGKLKRVVGIGGIHCTCCTLGPKNVTKRFWNRLDRRRQNRLIPFQLDE